MGKRLFNNIKNNFYIYLLCALNISHAVKKGQYDWLLLVSVFLTALSIALNVAESIGKDRKC